MNIVSGVIKEYHKVLLKPISRDLTSGILAHFPPEKTFVQSSEEWIGIGKGELSEHRLCKCPKKGKQADGMFVVKV